MIVFHQLGCAPLCIAEMKYDALDAEAPAGEILLRGPGLFSGYYKQEDKTAEVRAAAASKDMSQSMMASATPHQCRTIPSTSAEPVYPANHADTTLLGDCCCCR